MIDMNNPARKMMERLLEVKDDEIPITASTARPKLWSFIVYPLLFLLLVVAGMYWVNWRDEYNKLNVHIAIEDIVIAEKEYGYSTKDGEKIREVTIFTLSNASKAVVLDFLVDKGYDARNEDRLPLVYHQGLAGHDRTMPKPSDYGNERIAVYGETPFEELRINSVKGITVRWAPEHLIEKKGQLYSPKYRIYDVAHPLAHKLFYHY